MRRRCYSMAIAQKHGESSSLSSTSSVASYAGARRSCRFFWQRVGRLVSASSGAPVTGSARDRSHDKKNPRHTGRPKKIYARQAFLRPSAPSVWSSAPDVQLRAGRFARALAPLPGPKPISCAGGFFVGATRVVGAAAAASICAAPPLSRLAPSLSPAVRLKEPTATRRRGHRSLLQRPFSLSFSHISPSPPFTLARSVCLDRDLALEKIVNPHGL